MVEIVLLVLLSQIVAGVVSIVILMIHVADLRRHIAELQQMRDAISQTKKKIIPPQGGSGTAPPQGASKGDLC